METRANFILIGAFTILGLLGVLGFFMWLASVQLDRQYARYGVLFDNVAGLDSAGDVLFNGVGVGRVIAIRIWENDPRLVYVGIEIDATTPISAGTTAQLNSQGVTGVAYIELSGGAANAAPLIALDDNPPIIPSRRSSVQSLVDDAPDLLADASEVMAQITALTGPENQAHVAEILSNLSATTAKLDQALTDFTAISDAAGTAAGEIGNFTQRLETIGGAVEGTLTNTDAALAAATQAFSQAQTVMTTLDDALRTADTFVADDAKAVAEQMTSSLAQLDLLTAEATSAIAAIDTTLGAANEAFASAGRLMDTDLEPVLNDLSVAARQMGDAVSETAALLPDIATEIQGVVARADRVVVDVQRGVDQVLPGLTTFSSTGLAHLSQLGDEARNLVRSLNALVRRIEQDPARFLLDDRVPTYRR